jgi:hypothetical protein
MIFATEFVGKIKPDLLELEDPNRALGAQMYKKGIAPII